MAFDSQCKKAFKAIIKMYGQRQDPRCGTVICGYYIPQTKEQKKAIRKILGKHTPKKKRKDLHNESTLEHHALCMAMETILRNYFPDRFTFPSRPLIFLQIHDIVELKTLDKPDNGSVDPSEKAKKERKMLKKFLEWYTPDVELRRWITQEFERFELKNGNPNNFNYLVDKFAFIFSQCLERLQGNKGKMKKKGKKEKKTEDDRYIRILGTRDSLLITYAACLDKTRGIQGREILVRMMEVPLTKIYGRIPPKLRAFY